MFLRYLFFYALLKRRAAKWFQTAYTYTTHNLFVHIRQCTYCLLMLAPSWLGDNSLLIAGEVQLDKHSLTIVNRSITQDQGAWVVDYRFRYIGKRGIVIAPGEFTVKAVSWVSNSRIACHGLPRWSTLEVGRTPDLSAFCELIAASEEAERCRERLKVSVQVEDEAQFITIQNSTPDHKSQCQATPTLKVESSTAPLVFSVRPSEILHVRLRFEHEHILYGEYDPLLGARSVVLALRSASVNDFIPLNCEQYLAQPRFSWSELPEGRRDKQHTVSGPDSLHLAAHIPGHQYYRYDERPVRYGTQMRLRFWYLIATGTEGDCKVKVTQCKETPVAWRMLNTGLVEKCLKTVGRWTKVERIIQIEPEATKLTLEFTIVSDTDVGEMWIDDVTLEPVGFDRLVGP
jgi:hypothetical protein